MLLVLPWKCWLPLQQGRLSLIPFASRNAEMRSSLTFWPGLLSSHAMLHMQTAPSPPPEPPQPSCVHSLPGTPWVSHWVSHCWCHTMAVTHSSQGALKHCSPIPSAQVGLFSISANPRRCNPTRPTCRFPQQGIHCSERGRDGRCCPAPPAPIPACCVGPTALTALSSPTSDGSTAPNLLCTTESCMASAAFL